MMTRENAEMQQHPAGARKDGKLNVCK